MTQRTTVLGTKPTGTTINYRWSAMAAGMWSLELLQQTPVLPGFIYYSAVIIAREKGQRRHQALGRLALVQQTAILPNVTSLSAAISACEKGQQWQ